MPQTVALERHRNGVKDISGLERVDLWLKQVHEHMDNLQRQSVQMGICDISTNM